MRKEQPNVILQGHMIFVCIACMAEFKQTIGNRKTKYVSILLWWMWCDSTNKIWMTEKINECTTCTKLIISIVNCEQFLFCFSESSFLWNPIYYLLNKLVSPLASRKRILRRNRKNKSIRWRTHRNNVVHTWLAPWLHGKFHYIARHSKFEIRMSKRFIRTFGFSEFLLFIESFSS